MKKLLAVLMAAMLVLSLAACSGGSSGGGSDSGVGTWKLVSMSYGDQSISISDYSEMLGEDYTVTLEIKSDGTFTVDSMGLVQSGTWTANGSTYSLDLDGGVQEAKLSGGQLILEDSASGMSMVFEK